RYTCAELTPGSSVRYVSTTAGTRTPRSPRTSTASWMTSARMALSRSSVRLELATMTPYMSVRPRATPPSTNADATRASLRRRLTAPPRPRTCTQAPHRLDQLVAELASQVLHVDVDEVAGRLEARAPHPVEHLLAAEDASRRQQEELQHLELLGREPHELPALRDAAGGGVEGDVAPGDGAGPHLAAAAQRVEPRHELGQGEGLGEVVVAERQAAHPVGHALTRREERYRLAELGLPDGGGPVEPGLVALGEHDIEQHEVH